MGRAEQCQEFIPAKTPRFQLTAMPILGSAITGACSKMLNGSREGARPTPGVRFWEGIIPTYTPVPGLDPQGPETG